MSAAQKLTNSNKWPLLQFNERAIWGECQGSGKNPYRTRIDLNGNAFKCSCPSRKFPCKHGLALFLLYAEERPSFVETAECPDWVSEWLEGREQRAEKKKDKQQAAKTVDPKAQKKRQEKRDENVQTGLAELAQWLQDMVRVGFSDLPGKPYAYWENLAARMVDAQAPGLAAWVSRLGELVRGGGRSEDIMHSIAEEFGKLHLLISAFSRLESLSENLQSDIRSLIGWNPTETELLQHAGVADQWQVLGHRQTTKANLVMQTHWLFGINSERHAKIIKYTHANQKGSSTAHWGIGSVVQGALHFYPSTTPLRAIAGEHEVLPGKTVVPKNFPVADEVLNGYRDMLAQNPWLERYPILLGNIRIALHNQVPWVISSDEKRKGLAIAGKDLDLWKLLAVSGGQLVQLLGEWDGRHLYPIGVWGDQGYCPVMSQGAAL